MQHAGVATCFDSRILACPSSARAGEASRRKRQEASRGAAMVSRGAAMVTLEWGGLVRGQAENGGKQNISSCTIHICKNTTFVLLSFSCDIVEKDLSKVLICVASILVIQRLNNQHESPTFSSLGWRGAFT